ncbi:MAG TPA: EamA family transporter [Verrucomicrobiae bacterium]|jgi:drug/metabolite transporter (DMT)-like permease|nr:EamA family transporter [Verrucomicrobiae bacterium]
MPHAPALRPVKAALLLIGATVLWAASFILTKALGDAQRAQDPQAGTWLLSSLSLALRFGGATVVAGLWQARRLGKTTRSEMWQGVGLGVFGGVGIVFQMDGVMHTAASTCAFLTQCYCIFIPLFLVWRHRRWPAKPLAAGCVMVMAGVAILSHVDWTEFRLGRGEAETIISSIFFTAQILWLERETYAGNDSGRMSAVMFAATALVILPVVIASGGTWREGVRLYEARGALGIILFLTLGSTVAAYGIMNAWQRHVGATEAGLIYGCEPLFTAILALFAPAMLAQWTGVAYPNEHISARLLVGGGLIMAANVTVLASKALAGGDNNGTAGC